MSDYRFLKDVVSIKRLSLKVERLDMKISEAKDKRRQARLRKQKSDCLAEIDRLQDRYFE